MDESTKNYRTGELDGLESYAIGTDRYRVKVIGGNGTETKWLAIDEEELADIRGILTGEAVATALHILDRAGYAVRTYGSEDIHEVLNQYADDDELDTVTYRDQITQHIVEGDGWEGVLDEDNVTGYLFDLVSGVHNDHPEWFPEVKPENPLAGVPTPELVEEYVRLRDTPDAVNRYAMITAELRERGIIN